MWIFLSRFGDIMEVIGYLTVLYLSGKGVWWAANKWSSLKSKRA